MDWFGAYNIVRQQSAQTRFSRLSGRHKAAVLGNLAKGNSGGISNIYGKYDNRHDAPLFKRKISTEAPKSRRSEGESEELLLSDIVGQEAFGEFSANFEQWLNLDNAVRLSFSFAPAGSAPVVALLASAAANALAQQNDIKVDEIKINTTIGEPTMVNIDFGAGAEIGTKSVFRLGSHLSQLTTALSGLDARKAAEVLQSEEAWPVLSDLCSNDETFEHELEGFKGLVAEIKASARQVEAPRFEMVAERGKVEASYLGAKHKKSEVIFEFECNNVSQPIVEMIGIGAVEAIDPHQGSDAPITFNSGKMQIHCDHAEKEEVTVALGRRIDKLLGALREVDSYQAVLALQSEEGLQFRMNMDGDRTFEGAFAEWKSALEQGKFAGSDVSSE